jgi:hypothetical protein
MKEVRDQPSILVVGETRAQTAAPDTVGVLAPPATWHCGYS